MFGLLCSREGCPVACEVFTGNTADPMTVEVQVKKIKERFGVEKMALIGDRGMITTARIRGELEPRGLIWISVLKISDIPNLITKPNKGKEKPPLRPSEIKEDKVGETRSDLYPRERLMVCLNPRLLEERRTKRENPSFGHGENS